MSRYKPYSKYRESGVEWLGEMPGHWEVKKLKYIAHTQPSNIDKKSKDDEPDVLLCNYTDVYYNDFITNDMDFMKATATYDQINKFKLDVGDVIITKDSEGPEDIAMAAYVKETQDNLVCGYHLTLIKPTGSDGAYLFRAINSAGIHDQFKVAANGITRYGLSVYGIDNALLLLPSPKEQTTIASFLDHETAKIDTLIDKQQRLIALLKEKRQAVISHAVTKGLDPNVKMKDSGVAWLGEVPEHWRVLKIKYYGLYRSGDFISADQIEHEGKYPVLGGNGLRGYAEKYNLEGEYVLIGRQGALCGNINYSTGKFWATEHAIVVRHDSKKIAVRWLGEILRTMNLNQYSVSAAQPGLAVENIVNQIGILPPLTEQKTIAEYIEYETTKIDTLIEKANQSINLLKERRTALISAAVTGKIDVREAVA